MMTTTINRQGDSRKVDQYQNSTSRRWWPWNDASAADLTSPPTDVALKVNLKRVFHFTTLSASQLAGIADSVSSDLCSAFGQSEAPTGVSRPKTCRPTRSFSASTSPIRTRAPRLPQVRLSYDPQVAERQTEHRSPHPSPVAAVCGTTDATASDYKIEIRLQDQRVETVQRMPEMVRALLESWKANKVNDGKGPDKIVCFRDGISDGEFHQVVETEIAAIRRAAPSSSIFLGQG